MSLLIYIFAHYISSGGLMTGDDDDVESQAVVLPSAETDI